MLFFIFFWESPRLMRSASFDAVQEEGLASKKILRWEVGKALFALIWKFSQYQFGGPFVK